MTEATAATLRATNLHQVKSIIFTDFVLNSGDTLSSTASNSGDPIIIKVLGDVDISGTIDLKGKGFARGKGLTNKTIPTGDESNAKSGIGTPGNDGQDNGNRAIRGHGGVEYPAEMFMNPSQGAPRLNSGTGGGDGNGFSDDNSDDEASGGGGGASYATNGNDGGTQNGGDINSTAQGAGGDGGGCILFILQGNLSFTGTINISGLDGSDATAAGGGGGAGGMAYALYAGTLTDSGTKIITGGAGGNATSADSDADGGDGANGTIIFESVS